MSPSTQRSPQPSCTTTYYHFIAGPLPFKAFLTNNDRDFCGRDRHANELHLDRNDTENRNTKVDNPMPKGFFERFNSAVPDESSGINTRETVYESIEALVLCHE